MCVWWCSSLGTWVSGSMWCVINIDFLLAVQSGHMWGADVGCCGVHVDIPSAQVSCPFFDYRSWQRSWLVLRYLSPGNDPDSSAPTRKARTNCQNWTSPMARRMPLSWRCVYITDKYIYMQLFPWTSVTICCHFHRLMTLMLWRTSTPSSLMLLSPQVLSTHSTANTENYQSSVQTKDMQQDKMVLERFRGKLRSELARLSSIQTGWWCRLRLSLSSLPLLVL